MKESTSKQNFVEGEPAYVHFDTGATYSAMDLDVALVCFGITPRTPGVEPDGKAYTASGAAIDSSPAFGANSSLKI